MQTVCHTVIIQELAAGAGNPTQRYNIRIPNPTSPAIPKEVGQPHEFQAPYPSRVFFIGQIIGYVETTTAPADFGQWEL